MDLHEGCAPIDRSGALAPLPHDQPLGPLDAPGRETPDERSKGQ